MTSQMNYTFDVISNSELTQNFNEVADKELLALDVL